VVGMSEGGGGAELVGSLMSHVILTCPSPTIFMVGPPLLYPKREDFCSAPMTTRDKLELVLDRPSHMDRLFPPKIFYFLFFYVIYTIRTEFLFF
jgi:hypothetical protein